MEVTALCVRLWMDVLVLLLAQVNHSYFAHNADAAFPRVHPDRLQFFEYETFSVNCEEFRGLTEWRVIRRLNRMIPTDSYSWNSSAPSRTIDPTFRTDSGDYWCEDGDGNSSSVVNITITGGSVILDVPARPVMEGDDVILHCSKKESQSKHIADFYKDGSKLGTGYEKDMTIQNVSKSDEGLYKCSIAGAGGSPESWLTVSNQTEVPHKETPPSYNPSPDLPPLLWIIASVSALALLLLVMGLLLCKMHKILVCFSSGKPTPASHSPEDRTVSGGESAGDPDLVTYAAVEIKKKKRERVVSGGCTEPRSPDESVVYSSVLYRQLSSA